MRGCGLGYNVTERRVVAVNQRVAYGIAAEKDSRRRLLAVRETLVDF
jgi:hypothetical protein